MPTITEQRQGAVTVLRPEGALLQDDVEAFAKRSTEIAGPAMGRLVIDMANTPYVDSAGLEMMLDLSEVLEQCGQTLRLAGVCGTVREVLDLVGLTPRFEYFPDANSAVRSFL